MSLLENARIDASDSFETLDPLPKIMRSDSLTGSCTNRKSALLRKLSHDLFTSEERDLLKSALRNYRTGTASLRSLCDTLGKLITNSSQMTVVELIGDMLDERVRREFLLHCKRKVLHRNRKLQQHQRNNASSGQQQTSKTSCPRSATINIVCDHASGGTFYSPQLCRRTDPVKQSEAELRRQNLGDGLVSERSPYYSTPSLSTLPEESCSESTDDVNVSQLQCGHTTEEICLKAVTPERRRSSLAEQTQLLFAEEYNSANSLNNNNITNTNGATTSLPSSSTDSLTSQHSSNSSATVENYPRASVNIQPVVSQASHRVGHPANSSTVNKTRTKASPNSSKLKTSPTPPPRPPPPNRSRSISLGRSKPQVTASSRSRSQGEESIIRQAQENSVSFGPHLAPHEAPSILISVAADNPPPPPFSSPKSRCCFSSLKSNHREPRSLTSGAIDRPRRIGVVVEAEDRLNFAVASLQPVIVLHAKSSANWNHKRCYVSQTQALVHRQDDYRSAFTQAGLPLCNNSIQTEFIGLADKAIQTHSSSIM